jgi:hypothetical protein
MGDKRCRRSIRMKRFPVMDRQKGTFKIRETNLGLIEIRDEDSQSRRWGAIYRYSRRKTEAGAEQSHRLGPTQCLPGIERRQTRTTIWGNLLKLSGNFKYHQV